MNRFNSYPTQYTLSCDIRGKISRALSLKLAMLGTVTLLAASPVAFADVVNSPASNPGAIPETTAGSQVEQILGYTPDQNGISFQVASGGCTQPNDFRMQAEKNGENSMKLTLLRTRPDTCHSFVPTGQRIYLTYAQMGLEPHNLFVLSNPNGVVNSFVWGQN